LFPFSRVTHHNVAAFLVVISDSHLKNFSLVFNSKLFVYFILHWKTVAIPSETTRDIVASLRSVAADDIFDGASCDVPIMRGACSKGRSIIEGVRW
jgi:hypothetical protein